MYVSFKTDVCVLYLLSIDHNFFNFFLKHLQCTHIQVFTKLLIFLSNSLFVSPACGCLERKKQHNYCTNLTFHCLHLPYGTVSSYTMSNCSTVIKYWCQRLKSNCTLRGCGTQKENTT